MTSDIIRRIVAKMNELEEIAKSATVGPWRRDWAFGTHFVAPVALSNSIAADNVARLKPNQRADAEHIAAWDPATVLRGLAEDSDILRRHAPMPVMTKGVHLVLCKQCGWEENYPGEYREYPCYDVASLARRRGIEVVP